jgi:Rrf2 family transcriptional regulator, nitric oxide-sensitive transcriptional repressor
MQLTRFTDLGLRVVMLLATIGDGEAPSTRQMADQLNVSYNHATKVTARLAELAVVNTRRGRGGGLAITELGRTATVGWLARRLEGPGEVIQCEGDAPCPLRSNCRLRAQLRRAQEAFFAVLDELTLAELAEPPTRAVLLSLHPSLQKAI